MKTYWLLDVDGVLNATDPGWPIPGAVNANGKPIREVPGRGTAYAAGRGWQIRWSHMLMQRIRNIARNGDVEIVWATTWCGATDGLESLFRLPAFTDLWPDEQRFVGELKLNGAIDVIRRGDRLIWTDDMEVPAPGSLLYKELTKDGRALLIAPDPRKGLQPEHLDQIEAFIKGE